ncbi:cytochrome P450 [Corynespora cassiicola Philippines]|uniref:Cytochrome P450 n=1 Tax=Corynespora cassiicola Philippines TaxID=1448308 RepID=A0A2T2NHF5_CORCC|nr:cytochrome P450 [Corynespora cassiicola Philippines]
MLGLIFLATICVAFTSFFILLPVLSYFYDSKGLRKYPNYSAISGISNLSYCYRSACGFRTKDYFEAHKSHPILRIGPNHISFGRTPAIKEIYGHGTRCVKDLNYEILKGTHTHLIDVIDKPDHSRKRKLMSAAFAIKNLENWEYKVSSLTQRLIDAFDMCCSGPPSKEQTRVDPSEGTIDFNRWINLWTIEAINNIALSSNLGLLEQGDDTVVAERPDGTTYKARYREAQNQTSYAQSVFVWDYQNYHLLSQLSMMIPKWRRTWQQARPWDHVVLHQAAERLRRHQAGEKLDDFFACLMEDKKGQPNNLEWGEIVSEISVIINAGADTTAIALTQLMDLLLRHPEDVCQLREELDMVLEEDEIVAPYDKVKDLPFLRACLDEGLRLIPPTSTGLARRTPPEGCQILGEWIPGNTTVSMSIYGAHRDPEIFPEPEEFRPSRWMDPDERKRMEPHFIPFTTGARGCIGRNISYLEQAVVIATLFHRYEFALPGPEFALQRHEAFNILVGELPLKVWRRVLA